MQLPVTRCEGVAIGREALPVVAATGERRQQDDVHRVRVTAGFDAQEAQIRSRFTEIPIWCQIAPDYGGVPDAHQIGYARIPNLVNGRPTVECI